MSEPLYSTVELCVMIDTNYRDFVSALDETPPSTSPYQLNSRILATAMRACNVDIERLRTEATISPIRDASYVSYWIYRSKPIQLLEREEEGSSVDLFINEMFAVFILLKLLKIDQSDVVPSFYFKLIHHLRFHSIDAETLYLVASAISSTIRPAEA